MPEFNWGELMSEAGATLQPIPDGEYELQVTGAKAMTTSNNKPMLSVRYQVTAGPHTSRPVWNNFIISRESPNALGFFFRHMNAHGLGAEYFQSNPSMEQVADALVGRQVHATIGHKPYQGETRNEVSKFTPTQVPGGVVPSPAPVGGQFPVPSTPPVPAAPPVAAVPPAPPVAAAPVTTPPPPAAPVPAAPPVAAAPVAAPAPAPAPEPVAVPRTFNPPDGQEWNGQAWVWPPEQAAGYQWNGQQWVAPVPAPAAPTAPPAPPAPPTAPPAAPAVPF
jgi:hypothetical protein